MHSITEIFSSLNVVLTLRLSISASHNSEIKFLWGICYLIREITTISVISKATSDQPILGGQHNYFVDRRRGRDRDALHTEMTLLNILLSSFLEGLSLLKIWLTSSNFFNARRHTFTTMYWLVVFIIRNKFTNPRIAFPDELMTRETMLK